MIDRKFIKFLFVGGINTLFGYLMYIIFISTPLNREMALLLSYVCGVLWNFKTTGTLVFKNHDNKLIFRFILSYIITYFINLWFLNFVSELKWGEWLANFTLSLMHIETTHNLGKYFDQAILVLPVAMITFVILKLFVFREREKECSL